MTRHSYYALDFLMIGEHWPGGSIQALDGRPPHAALTKMAKYWLVPIDDAYTQQSQRAYNVVANNRLLVNLHSFS